MHMGVVEDEVAKQLCEEEMAAVAAPMRLRITERSSEWWRVLGAKEEKERKV